MLTARWSEQVNLQVVMLSDKHAVDTAVRESRASVDSALAQVKQQLQGMDILVSGCGIEKCNGRFKCVEDEQVTSALHCHNAVHCTLFEQ